MRIVSYDPTDAQAVNPGCPEGRTYKGQAFLSVPVLYATPGERAKPIGVINLTDRRGADPLPAGGPTPLAPPRHPPRAPPPSRPPPPQGLAPPAGRAAPRAARRPPLQ